MTQQAAQMARMDVRVPQAVKDTIDRAAAMQGRTRTDFLITAALEKAEQVIEKEAVIRLTLRDQEMLAKALIEKQADEPTPFIRKLVKEYAETVISE
jgi:uncharacterized protein (DUF1778 family)